MSLVILYRWYLEGTIRVLNVVYITYTPSNRTAIHFRKTGKTGHLIPFPRNSQKRKGQNGEYRPQDLCGFNVLSD